MTALATQFAGAAQSCNDGNGSGSSKYNAICYDGNEEYTITRGPKDAIATTKWYQIAYDSIFDMGDPYARIYLRNNSDIAINIRVRVALYEPGSNTAMQEEIQDYTLAPGEEKTRLTNLVQKLLKMDMMDLVVYVKMNTKGSSVTFRAEFIDTEDEEELNVLNNYCASAQLFTLADTVEQLADTAVWYRMPTEALGIDSTSCMDIMLYMENLDDLSDSIDVQVWGSCLYKDSLADSHSAVAPFEIKQRRVDNKMLDNLTYTDIFLRLYSEGVRVRFWAELVESLPTDTFYSDTTQVRLCEGFEFVYGDSIYTGTADTLLQRCVRFHPTSTTLADSIYSYQVTILRAPELPTNFVNKPSVVCGKAVVLPKALQDEVRRSLTSQENKAPIDSIWWEQGWWSDAEQMYTSFAPVTDTLMPIGLDTVALRYVVMDSCGLTLYSDSMLCATQGPCLEVIENHTDTVCMGDTIYGRVITSKQEWQETVHFIDARRQQRGDSIRYYSVLPYQTVMPTSLTTRTTPTIRAGRTPNITTAITRLKEQIISESPVAAPITSLIWEVYDEQTQAWLDAETYMSSTLAKNVLFRVTITTSCGDVYQKEVSVVAAKASEETASVSLERCEGELVVDIAGDTLYAASTTSWQVSVQDVMSTSGYRVDSVYRYSLTVHPIEEVQLYDTLSQQAYDALLLEHLVQDSMYVDTLVSAHGCDRYEIHYLSVRLEDALCPIQGQDGTIRKVWYNHQWWIIRGNDRYSILGLKDED